MSEKAIKAANKNRSGRCLKRLVRQWQDWDAAEEYLTRIGILTKESSIFTKFFGSKHSLGSFLFEHTTTAGTGKVQVLFKPSNRLATLSSALRAFDGKGFSIRKLAHRSECLLANDKAGPQPGDKI